MTFFNFPPTKNALNLHKTFFKFYYLKDTTEFLSTKLYQPTTVKMRAEFADYLDF